MGLWVNFVINTILGAGLFATHQIHFYARRLYPENLRTFSAEGAIQSSTGLG